MYRFVKSVVIKLLPVKILFSIENKLRYFHYILLSGNEFKCNICNRGLSRFQKTEGDDICPACGSLSRNRRLWDILKSKYLHDNINVLDFSPSRCLYRKLRKENLNYTSSDLSGDFISDVSFDITNIESKGNFYDLIICYHILEHVLDDKKAFEELFRVLKSNGTCIIQTPFKEGEIYEDYSIKSDEERKLHFGQEDHVRIYSVLGLKDRLEYVGFKVRVNEYLEENRNKYGFHTKEHVLICTK